jgi:hypothetical protein
LRQKLTHMAQILWYNAVTVVRPLARLTRTWGETGGAGLHPGLIEQLWLLNHYHATPGGATLQPGSPSVIIQSGIGVSAVFATGLLARYLQPEFLID